MQFGFFFCFFSFHVLISSKPLNTKVKSKKKKKKIPVCLSPHTKVCGAELDVEMFRILPFAIPKTTLYAKLLSLHLKKKKKYFDIPLSLLCQTVSVRSLICKLVSNRCVFRTFDLFWCLFVAFFVLFFFFIPELFKKVMINYLN